MCLSDLDHGTHLSFPTRRSSDLGRLDGNGDGITQLFGRRDRWGRTRHRLSAENRCLVRPHRSRRPKKIGRAHVELQSPMYLVCRLRLEKKKRIKETKHDGLDSDV